MERILVGYSDEHAICYTMYILSLNIFTTTDKVEFIENGESNELRKKELLHSINVEVPVINTKTDIKDYNIWSTPYTTIGMTYKFYDDDEDYDWKMITS